MTLRTRNLLLALIAAAGVGCTESPSSQVLTGRVGTTGAIAVRAVTTDSVVTAAQVRSDGTFTLALPSGKRYRLEVLTTSGVRHVLANGSGTLSDLTFQVCQPVDPFDIGGIGWGSTGPGQGGGSGGPGCDPGCDPTTDPDCGGLPPPPCDPSGTNCPPPPPPCDPADPNCVPPPPPCDPADPQCTLPPPPCDPTDPSCVPPPPPPPPWCHPGDPNCVPPPPPPCMDPSDPYCMCDASGQCPPPSCDPSGPTPAGSTGPSAGGMCPPPPPPPCADPTDPDTCNDPCMSDPASCGCAPGQPNCWPPPEPPPCAANGTMCDPSGGGMTPDHPPGDFGCMEQP
jgi:hypothetical protein